MENFCYDLAIRQRRCQNNISLTTDNVYTNIEENAQIHYKPKFYYGNGMIIRDYELYSSELEYHPEIKKELESISTHRAIISFQKLQNLRLSVLVCHSFPLPPALFHLLSQDKD